VIELFCVDKFGLQISEDKLHSGSRGFC